MILAAYLVDPDAPSISVDGDLITFDNLSWSLADLTQESAYWYACKNDSNELLWLNAEQHITMRDGASAIRSSKFIKDLSQSWYFAVWKEGLHLVIYCLRGCSSESVVQAPRGRSILDVLCKLGAGPNAELLLKKYLARKDTVMQIDLQRSISALEKQVDLLTSVLIELTKDSQTSLRATKLIEALTEAHNRGNLTFQDFESIASEISGTKDDIRAKQMAYFQKLAEE